MGVSTSLEKATNRQQAMGAMNRLSNHPAKPRVTVLMPAYNCRKYVNHAVASILSQTFRDFEFLIIDDGSNDGTPKRLRSIKDHRIRIVENGKNLGVAATLNRGIDMAQGEYIARMDTDDISLPDRLARQIQFMDANPQIGISGGWIRYFGNGLPYTLHVPQTHDEIASYMLFENPICHVAVVMRKKMIDENMLRYDDKFNRSEDFELWTRSIACFKIVNLPRVLVKARRNRHSATLSHWGEVTWQTEKILNRMLKKLDLRPSPEEVAFHSRVGRGYRLNAMKDVICAEQWLHKIRKRNRDKAIFRLDAFDREIGRVWFRSCANSAPIGMRIWERWRKSRLSKNYVPRREEMARFIASIAWHRLKKAFQKKEIPTT